MGKKERLSTDLYVAPLLIILGVIFIHAPVDSNIVIYYNGAFGEGKSIFVFENKIQVIEQTSKEKQHNTENIKIVQAFNIWLLILAIILFFKYIRIFREISITETLVSKKVRKNN